LVGKYVSLAKVDGADCAVAEGLDDAELESRLYRPAVPRASHQLAFNFGLIHQELKRTGVTLMLLWEEYATGNALAFKYTSFCIKYRENDFECMDVRFLVATPCRARALPQPMRSSQET
jgi:transposase